MNNKGWMKLRKVNICEGCGKLIDDKCPKCGRNAVKLHTDSLTPSIECWNCGWWEFVEIAE